MRLPHGYTYTRIADVKIVPILNQIDYVKCPPAAVVLVYEESWSHEREMVDAPTPRRPGNIEVT